MGAPVGETYIVRIYRREEKAPRKIVGVVEKVGDGGERSFRSTEELVELIVGAPVPGARRRSGKK